MSSPALDFLTSRAFPELAQAVRAVVAATVAAWEKRVREYVPSANQLTTDGVRDDLPIVLGHVADAMESAERYAGNVLADASPKHGAVRYHQGFKLDEVLLEYSLLRAVLVQETTSYLKRNLDSIEVLALDAAMDLTIRRSVTRFVEHLSGQLKAAVESQSKYLSFLSHDLRGGLNGIFLMIEVLKRELTGEPRLAETVEDLDIMRRSLMETVSTMDRFLYAERFRKGKIHLRPGRVVLRNLLNEAASHFSYQSKDKSVQLQVQAADEFAITSDRELLTLIFHNLISNAIKYSNAGGQVSIIARAHGTGVRVTVTDHGPGIAAEKLSELFAPFVRGETHGQPGVGLGLHIARHAAEYVGAKLQAESTVGEGSTFIVDLPSQMPKPPTPPAA